MAAGRLIGANRATVNHSRPFSRSEAVLSTESVFTMMIRSRMTYIVLTTPLLVPPNSRFPTILADASPTHESDSGLPSVHNTERDSLTADGTLDDTQGDFRQAPLGRDSG